METNSELQTIMEYLSVDIHTGLITWIKQPYKATKVEVGKLAGTDANGYIAITLNKKRQYAHRIIWFVAYGCWPDGEIDHINRVRDDNRVCNLRLASKSENQLNTGKHSNNSSGFKGVVKHGRNWSARAVLNKKRYVLGSFKTPLEAFKVYSDFALENHNKFFCNEGV